MLHTLLQYTLTHHIFHTYMSTYYNSFLVFSNPNSTFSKPI